MGGVFIQTKEDRNDIISSMVKLSVLCLFRDSDFGKQYFTLKSFIHVRIIFVSRFSKKKISHGISSLSYSSRISLNFKFDRL